MKNLGLGSLAALILALGSGYLNSAPEGGRQSSQASQPTPPQPTVARVHWLGKKQIAARKSSGYSMSIWNLPEAARLETQTLDKLALALTGELSRGGNNPSSTINSQLSTKLRPLLDDLVREEWYAEIQQGTRQSGELALAVRLDDQRAELWRANLTAVLSRMTNVQSLPAPASRQAWHLPLAPHPSRLDLARAGGWTLLGIAAETNGLLAEMSHRIRTAQTPVTAPGADSSLRKDPITGKVRPAPANPTAGDYWLDADLDLKRVSRALSLGWNLPDAWPRISATWSGQGDQIRTAGKLTFPQPLNLQLEPWNIPTNLIRAPLVSFCAVRGVRSWLAGQDWVKHFQIEPVPNQFCAWALGSSPALTAAATPMRNAEALLQTIGPRVVAERNPWIANHALGLLEFTNTPPILAWSAIPMFAPALEIAQTPSGPFLVGRLGPRPPVASKPAPPELFAQLIKRPDLVYYDWEFTQPKLNHWVYLGQTARLAFILPQMPSDSAAFDFLLKVAPKLGNTGTEVFHDGASSLSFVRNSHLGFTAIELHLLADWLESPAFPRGFHSLLAPKPVKSRPPGPGSKATPVSPAAAPRPANSPKLPR